MPDTCLYIFCGVGCGPLELNHLVIISVLDHGYSNVIVCTCARLSFVDFGLLGPMKTYIEFCVCPVPRNMHCSERVRPLNQLNEPGKAQNSLSVCIIAYFSEMRYTDCRGLVIIS